jgi:hypothetical protein
VKNIFVSALAIVAFTFLLPAILSFGVRYIPFDNQAPLGETSKIFGDKVFEQSFVVNGNNLVAIGMSFRNPNLRNKKDIKLDLYSKDNKIISQSTFNGDVVPDGGFVRFAFEPSTLAKGDTVRFTLSAPDANEENALEVFLTEGGEGAAFVDYYKPPARKEFIKSIYKGWFNRFLADKPFAVCYLALIFSLILLSKFPSGYFQTLFQRILGQTRPRV